MTDKNNIIYYFLSIIAVFFCVNRFLIPIIIFFILILLYMMRRERKLTIYVEGLTKVIVVMSIMCLGYFVLSSFEGFSTLGSSNYALKELSRCLVYLIIVQILLRIKVDLHNYINLWIVLLTISVGVAILQYTKVVDMNTILQNFYGESIQYLTAENTELSSFRCGSIFVNPNVFACFLVACLGSYLVLYRNIKRNYLRNVFVFVMCIIGFILSGSRTGFLLCIIIIAYHLITEMRKDKIYFFRFIRAIIIGLILLFVMFQLIGVFDKSIIKDLRIFQFSAGMENSFGIKINIFLNLIRKMSVLNILIGYGPFDYSISSNYLVDFDLGYFIVYYGIIGIVLYIALLNGVLNFGFKENNHNLEKMLVIIMIVFGFTAGTYFNLRIFSIYLLMFLPVIVNNNDSFEEIKYEKK